ncbi:FLJ37770-like protein [Trichonephila clavipes]|nr:FLJ37770-like protein [Trichonephila clavipes]
MRFSPEEKQVPKKVFTSKVGERCQHEHALRIKLNERVYKRSGRPISSRTLEAIEKARNFLANDHCASLRLLEESLSTNQETTRTILHEDLGKTKACAKFVPFILTPEQKVVSITDYRYIISAAENGPNFLKSIVTGDKS